MMKRWSLDARSEGHPGYSLAEENMILEAQQRQWSYAPSGDHPITLYRAWRHCFRCVDTN